MRFKRALHEIDPIAEYGGSLKALEIKSSMTFNSDFFKNFSYFEDLSSGQFLKKFLVFDGEKGLFKNTGLIHVDDIESTV